MTATETELRVSRRQLMLRDGLAFLVLTASTGVLFGITLLLFRSFSDHRAELAREFSERGHLALTQGRPRDAISDLRAALSYAPGERDYELMLAQALGDDGRIEEATNYFLNLWDAQPGDGFINLQLARLARRRNDQKHAIEYYRASIYGSWDGDGVVHRRDVRLELADYLIELKQFSVAQAELLIASSNAPSIPDLNIALGDKLLRVNDQADALKEYRKAMLEDPHHALAFAKAGRLAYQMGDYASAKEWLEKALRESAGAPGDAAEPAGDTATLLKNAERLLALDPERAADRGERVSRLLNEKAIARKRFDACAQQAGAKGTLSPAMQTLSARWSAANSETTRVALIKDPSNEELLGSLIGDSEVLATQVCGPAQDDDTLLLLLAGQTKNP